MADDRLSQLPDELLITIISSTLTLKEAAATSILSKRWKTLWTCYYGILDFDFHSHLRFEKKYFGYSRPFEECRGDYVNHVNKVLRSHQGFGVPINKFRICWMMRNETYKTILDSWINFAMRKRVQHIELDLCLVVYNSNYKFPHGIGFPNLTVLQLTSVDVTDETLDFLISSDKCPLLQHISVKHAPSLEHVKVVGNFKLKSLEFDMCWGVKCVEISSALNLVSFGFCGLWDPKKITFEAVPLLTKALFGIDCFKNTVMQLSSFLSQLEILVLDLVCFDNLVGATNFPKFDRLKRLELQAYSEYHGNWNLSVMAMIFRCPRLQKLSLKMIYMMDYKVKGLLHKKIHYKNRHECLQAVEYVGWNGKKNELELITDILKNTMLLDKVTIDPCTTFCSNEHELRVICSDNEFRIHDKKREEAARKVAVKLRTILPVRVTLEIL